MTNSKHLKSGYAEVTGISMYYEMHGQGDPLVLIHGGGSTIETSFGRIIPFLANHRQIIAVELQGHGHTTDRDTEMTFEQDAEDVAALLESLQIRQADFLGFSNGATVTIEIALRFRQLARKIILCSTFYKRSAVAPQFWEGFDHATLNDMPVVLRDGFLAANNNADLLLRMFNKEVQRMKLFKGWTDDEIRQISAPTLVITGDHDVAPPEHAVEMFRNIPGSELAIFPGGHGAYLGAIESLENGKWMNYNASDLIGEFLDKKHKH